MRFIALEGTACTTLLSEDKLCCDVDRHNSMHLFPKRTSSTRARCASYLTCISVASRWSTRLARLRRLCVSEGTIQILQGIVRIASTHVVTKSMQIARHIEGSSLATARHVHEECAKRLAATNVDACCRVGRARLRDVEQRTTTGTLRTHMSLDAPGGCRSLARVPRTWTTARMRRTDGFQSAGSVFDEEATAMDDRHGRQPVELLRGSGSAAAPTRT